MKKTYEELEAENARLRAVAETEYSHFRDLTFGLLLKLGRLLTTVDDVASVVSDADEERATEMKDELRQANEAVANLRQYARDKKGPTIVEELRKENARLTEEVIHLRAAAKTALWRTRPTLPAGLVVKPALSERGEHCWVAEDEDDPGEPKV